jgi:hypothetical protein
MARQTASIDIDAYADLDVDGIMYNVYFGDECDPAASGVIEWDDIINSIMEMHAVPSGPIVVDIRENHDGVQEIYNMIDTLREVAEKLESRVRSSDILLRHNMKDMFDKDNCITDYNGYLEEIVNGKS